MKWQKKGLIFCPDGRYEWSLTHAQVPTVLALSDRLRIFFSTRNQFGKSQIGLLDVDIRDPSKILYLHSEPVLSFGKPGAFDDEGVMPSYVERRDNQLWMYYTGWNQRGVVPYHNAMGIAVSDDEGFHFYRLSDGPIMDRTFEEPYIAVTPHIIRENNVWRMWYSSGLGWELVDDRYEPIYVIKYAESHNGTDWVREKKTVIDQAYPQEAFSRPCAIKINGQFHLWYCYRGCIDFRDGSNAYKIGYSFSLDGKKWIRKDQDVGISISQTGWDSKMLCYPYVVKENDCYYMFYNGNGFGKSGFGYAILKQK